MVIIQTLQTFILEREAREKEAEEREAKEREAAEQAEKGFATIFYFLL